jgi:hypothetical protein
MSDHYKLQELLPPEFLRLIRDRIKAGVVDAENLFHLNQDEEDSITGALAQAISTKAEMAFDGPDGSFGFKIESYKIRGRGIGAPEKHLGADGILQISVSTDGHKVFSKGLPFQAKKFGGFKNADVLSQASDLLRTTETGVVIRYSDEGYTAMDVRNMVEVRETDGTQVRVFPPKLATVFGDSFLDCEIGRVGLSFDRESVGAHGKGSWVIDAQINQIE